jgi:predicted dehydrogenase
LTGVADARFAAVFGRGSDRGRRLGEQFSADYVPDPFGFAEAPKVDAVIVALPHALHARAAIAAARAGLHVLVEKPIATTLADADRMIKACRRTGVTLMVGQTHRFVRSLIAARERIQSGQIGTPSLALDVTVISSTLQQLTPWYFDPHLAAGGVLMSSASHRIDRVRWLLGEVEEVHARLGAFHHQIRTEDTAVLSLRLASGAMVAVLQEVVAYDQPGKVDLDVFGTRGSLHHEFPNHLVMNNESGATDLSVTDDQPLVRELEEFVGAIREGRPPSVPGEEGRSTLAVLRACYESSRLGEPVQVQTMYLDNGQS